VAFDEIVDNVEQLGDPLDLVDDHRASLSVGQNQFAGCPVSGDLEARGRVVPRLGDGADVVIADQRSGTTC
jgi:hypothetical protein